MYVLTYDCDHRFLAGVSILADMKDFGNGVVDLFPPLNQMGLFGILRESHLVFSLEVVILVGDQCVWVVWGKVGRQGRSGSKGRGRNKMVK
jgi:hypothetical protein